MGAPAAVLFTISVDRVVQKYGITPGKPWRPWTISLSLVKIIWDYSLGYITIFMLSASLC